MDKYDEVADQIASKIIANSVADEWIRKRNPDIAAILRSAFRQPEKTVPMEMLWRIAGEGLAANGGRRIDEAKLRGIAAKYGYKVE